LKNKSKILTTLLRLIKAAIKQNEIPSSCLLVNSNYQILFKAHNLNQSQKKVSAHAEIIVINKAIKNNFGFNLSNLILISSHEPCMMCLGAIKQAKIKNIIYLYDQPKFGFLNSNFNFDHSKIKVKKLKLLKSESDKFKSSFNLFFQKLRTKK